MEIFMQDIEEDPEIRQNVNLFRDDDVIERLNAQMSKLDLGGKGDENDEPKKSPIGQALDAGTATVGNEQRKVVKGARKTTKGKVIQEQEEKARKQQEKFLKLQYPKADDEEDDWESDVEEDFPHV